LHSGIDDAKLLANNAVEKVKKAFIGTKEEAPEFLQDNEFIKNGYRIDHNSCCVAAKSLFTCHNESVNVWSHLIGSVCYLGLFIALCIIIIPKRFETGRDLISEYNSNTTVGLIPFINGQLTQLQSLTNNLFSTSNLNTSEEISTFSEELS